MTSRILIAEDEESIRRILTMILEDLGFEVRVVEDGGQALSVLDTGDLPDLLITDVHMPEVDGGAVADRVQVAWPQVRLIVMSGSGFTGVPDRIWERGALRLDKPFDIETLRDVLGRVGLGA